VLSNVEDSKVFDGLDKALNDVEAQNMVDLRNQIESVYTKQIADTETGWITVTKNGDNYESHYLPTVQITAKAKEETAADKFKIDLQNLFNIGLADEVSINGDTLTASYNQPLNEVLPRIEWLAKLYTDGLDGYENILVAFPPTSPFATLHEYFKVYSGYDAHKIEYTCALNKHASSENNLHKPTPEELEQPEEHWVENASAETPGGIETNQENVDASSDSSTATPDDSAAPTDDSTASSSSPEPSDSTTGSNANSVGVTVAVIILATLALY